MFSQNFFLPHKRLYSITLMWSYSSVILDNTRNVFINAESLLMQQMRCMGITARAVNSHSLYCNFFLTFHEIITPVPQYGMWQYLYLSTTFNSWWTINDISMFPSPKINKLPCRKIWFVLMNRLEAIFIFIWSQKYVMLNSFEIINLNTVGLLHS